jgi:transposase
MLVRVLKVEDWAEIRRLHRAEGMAIRAIARQLVISRNTVKKPTKVDQNSPGTAGSRFSRS